MSAAGFRYDPDAIDAEHRARRAALKAGAAPAPPVQPWRDEIRADGTRVDASGVGVRRRRMTFEEIEAARLAREGKNIAPSGRPVIVPAAAPPSASAEWLTKFRGPFPANASKRAPRACGLCGSREHDRRNHARVVEQEKPTGILPPAPPAEPVVAPEPAIEPDAPPAAMAQDKAREIALKKATGRSVTLSPNYSVRAKERRSFALTVLTDEEESARPRTRGDCKGGPRPCPWASCAHHLAIDVNPDSGSIKFNHPGKELWEMEETCALDVADRGGITLEEVGVFLGLTRERIRQVEVRGLTRLKINLLEQTEGG